jgi:hypothetical protein
MNRASSIEPTDVAIAANGDIFVTEGHVGGTKGNDRVSKFSKDGKFIKSWGKTGSGPGEFNAPHTIAIDSQGRLFVGDRNPTIASRSSIRMDATSTRGCNGAGPAASSSLRTTPCMWPTRNRGARMNRAVKKGIRIGSAKTGIVDFFIEDMESTTEEHSGAEGVGVDAAGNVYGAVVRRQMLEKHIKLTAPAGR